jgi:RNA polymerase sigma-70 factor (ECF subfamily)
VAATSNIGHSALGGKPHMSEHYQQIAAQFLADRHRLMAFICGLLRDAQASEDVFQEVWLKLSGELEKGVVIQNPPAWCRKVARNLILMHWRSQKGAKVIVDSTLIEFLDSVEQAFTENEAVNETGPERRRALGECLSALPEKSRHLIALKYEQELPLKDIATKVGQSCDSVIKALVRLRHALVTCVEKKLKLQELGL